MTMQETITQTAQRITEAGIIAVIRGDFSLEKLLPLAEAMLDGGVAILEVTLNSSHALAAIEHLRAHLPDPALVGAGTVRSAANVDAALNAGSQFLVSPNFDPISVARSQSAGVLHLPGVFTASEAQAAFAAGCRMLKLFPATALGPDYLRALRAPLNDIAFVPTGGIDEYNLGGYIQAGAAAVGIGSSLLNGPNQVPAELRQQAARLVRALRQARTGLREV